MKIIAPISLALIYTGLILYFAKHSSKLGLTVSKNSFINFHVNYQLLLVGIAIISLISSYFLNHESFRSLFSFGNIQATAEELKIFGIKKNDTWLKTGISLSIVISLVTGIFMFFQFKGMLLDYSLLKSSFLWILLFSISNAFAEEMIYRIGINSPLAGLLQPNTIFLISAILFGIAHFQGMPNGVVGVLLAGLLGYILSKSVHETNGFFWALTIHFLQDVIIFSSIFLLKTKI